jgi:STE24 endopeptidase
MYATLLISCVLVLSAQVFLEILNLRHQKAKGSVVPPEFEGAVDRQKLSSISAYTFDHGRFGLVVLIVDTLIMMAFYFSGILGKYDNWIAGLSGSFVAKGIVFAMLLVLAGTILEIPSSLYSSFVLEKKYGFNTMTPAIWLTDFLKSLAISSVLGAAVVATALLLVSAAPHFWWFWVWLFLLLFSLLLMYISPVLIEPLFFKFEPLKIEGLEHRIRDLAERAGVKVSRVFQVDASRRSTHSNAYFTGIGKVKRIVLFDTLIAQMTPEQIEAVLAHELGHWKKKHVLKSMLLFQFFSFVGLLLLSRFISWDGLPGVLHLTDASWYARALILGLVAKIIFFPGTAFTSYFSRRNEYAADAYAVELTRNASAMASSLVVLSRENLSNLHPHPWYAKFYYSHPPVVERIRAIRSLGNS